MSFFRQPKPRSFHHEPIYYEEHSERVCKIKSRARRELGLESAHRHIRDEIKGSFSNESRRLERQRRRVVSGSLLANAGALLVIILALLLVWIYLSV